MTHPAFDVISRYRPPLDRVQPMAARSKKVLRGVGDFAVISPQVGMLITFFRGDKQHAITVNPTSREGEYSFPILGPKKPNGTSSYLLDGELALYNEISWKTIPAMAKCEGLGDYDRFTLAYIREKHVEETLEKTFLTFINLDESSTHIVTSETCGSEKEKELNEKNSILLSDILLDRDKWAESKVTKFNLLGYKTAHVYERTLLFDTSGVLAKFCADSEEVNHLYYPVTLMCVTKDIRFGKLKWLYTFTGYMPKQTEDRITALFNKFGIQRA